MNPEHPADLQLHDVHRVARLARLRLSDEQARALAGPMGAVLSYVELLRELDLAGVEPLANVLAMDGRLGADEPGPVLPNAVLMGLAPAKHEPFVRVPKVLGDGGGA